MHNLLALLIFLLYFCVFYVDSDSLVPKPGGPEFVFSTSQPPVETKLSQLANTVSLEIDGQPRITFELPDQYVVTDEGTIVQKDACLNMPNGSKTLATGRNLYDYVQKRGLVDHRSQTLRQHVQRVLQQGHIFYFECDDERIKNLHVCEGGTILLHDSCVPIDDCIDRTMAYTFTDVFDKDYFFQCIPRAKRKKCPAGTYFVHDSCRRLKSIDPLCKNGQTFFALDANSYIRCDEHGNAQKFHCPPGHVLFGEKCEVDWCVGKTGRVPLPEETYQNLFVYSPGYAVCDVNGRVQSRVRCKSGEPGEEEDLSQLPMVFDGRDCAPPSLCDTVHPIDPNGTVVPTREYSRRLESTWNRAHLFDESVGFQCNNGTKRRIPCENGQCIKNYKLESACGDRSKVVIGDKVDVYYDCASQQTLACPADHFFNGVECQKRIEHAHKFRGLDIFKILSSEWMEPWNYSNDPSPFKKPKLECLDPESEYIYGYNMCSHPHCAPFGYLKQFQTFVILPDAHVCLVRDGKLVKTTVPVLKSGYQFWNQRGIFKLNYSQTVPAAEDPCTFGQNLNSGNFAMDSVMYVTCDTVQPFVFCPAASTTGIVEIDGVKGNKLYACAKRDPGYGRMGPGEIRSFHKNQLEKLRAFHDGTVLVINDVQMITLQRNDDYEVAGNEIKIATDKSIELQFKYTVTHPLHAYYEGSEAKGGTPDQSFIMKRADLTNKPMDVPKYDLLESVPDFNMWGLAKSKIK